MNVFGIKTISLCSHQATPKHEEFRELWAQDILPHFHARHVLILLSFLLTPPILVALFALLWKSDLQHFQRQQVW